MKNGSKLESEINADAYTIATNLPKNKSQRDQA